MRINKNIPISIKQFVKYGLVGVLNTIITISVIFIFMKLLNVSYIISNIVGYLFGFINSFFLNKIWTFKENIKINAKIKYLQFSLVSFIALLVNLFFLYVFTELLGIYYIISQVLAIGIALIINFLGNKIWTFSK